MYPLKNRLSPTFTAIALALASPALCQTTEDHKLLPADGVASAMFGSSTAMDNGTIAIGAMGDDDNGPASGSAYLFGALGNNQLHKLLPSDGAAGDEFGSSIAISLDLVVVGARGADDHGLNSGSAYVFDAGTGNQLFKLTPNDGAAGDQFGFAVAVDDGLIAVGAKRDDDNGMDSGSVYLFDAISGAQVAKILPNDGSANDNFGESVAIDNGVLAVGAHGDSDNGPLSGSAYLFHANTGALISKLLPLDGGTNDFFGTAIAIDNGIVVVGAWADSVVFDHSGSAYLFDASTGSQISKLIPSDGHDRDHFGYSVAIGDGIVAIGAERDGDSGFNAGSAYTFDATTGLETAKLLASDGDNFDVFGSAIATDGGMVLVGAHRNDDLGSSSGSAYVFGNNACPAPQNYCQSTVHSAGTAATMGWGGSLSITNNDFELQCNQCPPNQFGLFLYGPNQIQIGLGPGFLCVGGPFYRLPLLLTDQSGLASLQLDLLTIPGMAPGMKQNFQLWFRDPMGPGGSTFNLSDGLEVTFCD